MQQEAGRSQAKQRPSKTPSLRCRQVIETAQAVPGYFYPSKRTVCGGSLIPFTGCAILQGLLPVRFLGAQALALLALLDFGDGLL